VKKVPTLEDIKSLYKKRNTYPKKFHFWFGLVVSHSVQGYFNWPFDPVTALWKKILTKNLPRQQINFLQVKTPIQFWHTYCLSRIQLLSITLYTITTNLLLLFYLLHYIFEDKISWPQPFGCHAHELYTSDYCHESGIEKLHFISFLIFHWSKTLS